MPPTGGPSSSNWRSSRPGTPEAAVWPSLDPIAGLGSQKDGPDPHAAGLATWPHPDISGGAGAMGAPASPASAVAAAIGVAAAAVTGGPEEEAGLVAESFMEAADIMAELGPEGGAEEMLEGAMQAPGTTMPIPTLMQQQGAAAGAHQPQGPLRPASPAAAAAATLASSPRGMTRGPLAGAFEPAPAEAMGLQGPGQGTAGAAGAAAAAAQAATQELEHLADLLDQIDVGSLDLGLVSRTLLRLGPRQLLLKDKAAFVLGSTCLWLCAWWLGAAPSSFYRLYTGLGVVLFAARYAVYRARKWHYFLLDLCYACNALLLAHLWLAPRSPLLAATTFAFNTGPLTMSILTFRNSLVYHDLDKVTSLYLHLAPAFVSWSTRWHPDQQRFGQTYTRDKLLTRLVLVPMFFYAGWATFYYSIIFYIAAERIKRRRYTTLFTYCTTQHRGFFHAIASRVPARIQPAVYLALHMAYCATTMLLAIGCWRSYALHTCLLLAVTTASIYHGGSYYFEVFRIRHMQHSAGGPTPRGTPKPKTN